MNLLHKLLVKIDEFLDKRTAEQLRAESQSLYVQCYNSFGSETEIRISGRVLVPHRRFKIAKPDDGIFTNLMNMYFRIYSREIADVRVRFSVENIELFDEKNSQNMEENMEESIKKSIEESIEITSDSEGYLKAVVPLKKPLPAGIYALKSEVVGAPFQVIFSNIIESKIFIYNKNSALGLISDIDDTAIFTQSYNGLKTLYNTFLFNAFRRKTLPNVEKWYNELTENGKLPTFYLSSSPWNLYDVLLQILRINNLPEGTVLLRDYGIDYDKMLLGSHSEHKRKAIDDILAAYPNTAFILSGDTAQHDPDIYLAAAKDYPSRIQTIFIRDVGLPKKRARITPLLQEAQSLGIDMRVI